MLNLPRGFCHEHMEALTWFCFHPEYCAPTSEATLETSPNGIVLDRRIASNLVCVPTCVYSMVDLAVLNQCLYY